jgi:LmbE family N-acetylglucosaminyl deacetylase
MYRSVVAVGAHPDDVEGGCGGTLIKLADAGCRVTMVSITNGDKGSFDEPDIDVAEVARIRDAESRAAAATIGATYVCLGQEDQFLFDGRGVRLALADVLRQAEADLVLASPPSDYQADHTLTGDIAIEACHLAALPQIASKHPALAYDPVMYYYDATLGLDFQPTFYVDISDVLERKLRMVSSHASQSSSAQKEHGWSLEDAGVAKARLRGLQSGVMYAEGYAPCLRWPRVRALSTFPF